MEKFTSLLKHTAALTFVIAALLICGCKSNNDIRVAKDPEILGIATPIAMQPDSTVIELGDYFRHPNKIDSVFLDKTMTFRITPDSAEMIITIRQKPVPRLSVMTVWMKGYPYSLMLERSRKVWQHFTFDPKDKKYTKVELTGDMNDWVPAKTPLRNKDGIWQTDLLLFPGKYQYQIVADGKWMLDPANPEKHDNGNGGNNSVMNVGSINPVGAPNLYTYKAEKHKLTIGLKNEAQNIFVFWQNYSLDSTFWKKDSTGIVIKVPRKARDFDRSFIRVWASNAQGTSNEILVPLEKGKVLTNVKNLTRSDLHTMVIYFMMVDRFKNGDPKNDAPLKDPEVDKKLNFQGGDIAGILKEIEDGYFKDLGVNTLWISPITQNPPDAWAEYIAPHRKYSGYHGYWPVTLTSIDNHFGTPDVLTKMIDKAHGRDMNVLLDYVSNHVHQSCAIYKAHPDWATPLILPDKRKNLRLWNEQRLTTWFDEFLPTLDLSRPEVFNLMSDSALYWIKKYKFDGFRHDACKHVPEIYWRTLTKKLKEQVVAEDERPVYQIGESFGSRDLISSYVGPGMLDAQFDFDLYFDARNVFAKDNTSFKDLSYSLQESFNYFGEHSLMGNITGNQDLPRFISFASGALGFNEDDHEAGWKRDIEVKDTIGYNKLASLIAFNMTIPGVPTIYYGDEYGMPGANDPDNRRMMKFENLTPQENRLKETVSKLIHTRTSSMPLLYGDFKTISVSDN
ncbi:MAG: alpha-amylase family glycosyl hydrolase, partial [Bacteroidota bacterium]|nr:alpha-amylase family glycosyl hydrolase [Bacteroidota bacterium]